MVASVRTRLARSAACVENSERQRDAAEGTSEERKKKLDTLVDTAFLIGQVLGCLRPLKLLEREKLSWCAQQDSNLRPSASEADALSS
ncbi:MAG: hypothetical protein JWO56_2907 [Acidobacteria bacterium]|nr:hypothetical protein [Acidobacteriota bacterium]